MTDLLRRYSQARISAAAPRRLLGAASFGDVLVELAQRDLPIGPMEAGSSALKPLAPGRAPSRVEKFGDHDLSIQQAVRDPLRALRRDRPPSKDKRS